jgi:hypothetical protein
MSSLRTRFFSGVVAAALAVVSGGLAAWANVPLTQISSDPFITATGQHRTEVEPDTFAAGSTIVSAFQVGRFFNGGASDVGFATSLDGGSTWTDGFLAATTVNGGKYDRASDASVAFDARHNVWLISYLGIFTHGSTNENDFTVDVVVARSTDGGLTWTANVPVDAPGNLFFDKNWTVCDNTPSSPFFGNCYTEFDNASQLDLVLMSTSNDGGLTWGPALTTQNHAVGLGGQPLVQPNGTVIVPIDNAFEATVLAFTSTNGGASWGPAVVVSPIRSHRVAGGLRTSPLVSAEMDAAGTAYVVWQDCRFRIACTSNDIVLTSSADGSTWSKVTRVPIDSTRSGADHFIPGLAVDRTTSGASAHLGLTFYFYPVAACTASTCQLNVGYISSVDGGATWGNPTQLAGSISLSWLPSTNQGVMVGDYISTSIVSGLAHGVFADATAPKKGLFNEAMFTPTSGLPVTGQVASGAADPVVSSASDFGSVIAPLTAQ